MATTRFAAQNARLQGTENADALLGKAGLGKPRLTSATTRSALSNIGNKAAQTQDASKKATKPVRMLPKSKATSTLQKVVDNKENAKATKEAVTEKCQSPAPMDISGNSQSNAFSSVQLCNVNDIDKDDADNPQLVSEYVGDIYQYMRELERRFSVKQKYLDGRDVNGRMRGILIDWLVQVHLRFHLLQETLYLTMAIIDRFLQTHDVNRNKLQLVGVTSMLIASKYEEMYAPEIGDFEYITDNAYSKADIRKMECLILKTLDFSLGKPLPLHFLRRNSKAGEVDATKHTLAKYLMELTIVDYEMVHYHPSEIAAAALCLSMKVLDHTTWDDTLQFYSKYSEDHLLPIMKRMAVLVTKAGAGKLTAIYTKYKSSKFMKISVIPELKSQVIQELAKADS